MIEAASDVIDCIDVDKVGTSLLVKDLESGTEILDSGIFRLIGQMVLSDGKPRSDSARKRVLVTSAGITAGMLVSGVKQRPDIKTEMHELQRLASKGWHPLLNKWETFIGKSVGGVLLTLEQLNPEKPERQEAVRLIHTLLKHDEDPILNEDDSVSHEEIRFGGNDILAAKAAASLKSSPYFGDDIRLFLMTDVNGVYEDINDPNTRIPVIANTTDHLSIAQGPVSPHTVGGMLAKFFAAEIAREAGIDMWIFDPRLGDKEAAVRGEIGTHFPARA